MNVINGYDVLIAGAGVAGLNCALHLPPDMKAFVVCKGGLKQSDSRSEEHTSELQSQR